MLSSRATTFACGLLALWVLGDLTVVVAVLLGVDLQYRGQAACGFAAVAAITALLAWRLWRRSRWAYRASLAVSGLLLLSSLAAFSHHSESLAGLAGSALLVGSLVAAYPEFRVPPTPLYLTPSERG